MLANIGVPGLVLILVIALIIFGPAKLPEVGKAAGSTIREFKKATTGLMSGLDDEPEKPAPKKEAAAEPVEEKEAPAEKEEV